MQLPWIVVHLLVLCLASSFALDFCKIDGCKGLPHLGCNNNLTFHKDCMPKHRYVNIQMYKEYLLKIHNKYRQDVASGTVYGLPTARCMPELVWHPKLALMAQYHAKRCLQSISSYCVMLPNITNPAINFGESWLRIAKYHPSWASEHITIQTENWLHQVYKLARNERSELLPEIRNILSDKNYFMGCASGEDYDGNNSRFVLICYFNEKYDWKKPIYQVGQFSSTNCELGRSSNYPHLCKTDLYTEE